MKKKKSKILASSLLGLLLLFSIVVTASAYTQKYDCSTSGQACQGVEFKGYGTPVEYSDYVYAKAGQSLSVSNDSTGAFNLVTQLVDSNNKAVGEEVYFTDTKSIRVPGAGNYKVKVSCKDTSIQERCTGFGQVSQ
ncbi:hypothetical protein [Lysinibacillus boronitolerans]|uniref:hypothetical protein n=1 Tax=Lysinibacillus boronitolerans TaxID=309788 RepID=UPI003852EB82